MEDNDVLVRRITKAVIACLHETNILAQQASRSHNKQEVVIGVGPAFGTEITHTINGIPLTDVLAQLRAGIAARGLSSRVVQVFQSSDVSIIGKEAANLSGSGIGIGIQSKGTTMIHRSDLENLSNIELFPQAPLLTLQHYRNIGENAAQYAKGEPVIPITVENDPMVRAAFQVKAALMHRIETAKMDRSKASIEWEVT